MSRLLPFRAVPLPGYRRLRVSCTVDVSFGPEKPFETVAVMKGCTNKTDRCETRVTWFSTFLYAHGDGSCTGGYVDDMSGHFGMTVTNWGRRILIY